MLCNFTVWREHLFCALNCPNHKFGSNPNILSFVLSKLWNIFQRLFFFNVNYFARSPPLGHINLLCANSSHSLRWYLCLPKVPWMCIQSHTNSVNIPSVSSWFCTQLTSDSNFNSSSMIFFFCFSAALSSLLGNFRFWLSIFLSLGFITGRREVSTIPCFAVCAWTDYRCPMSKHRQTLKEAMWLVTDQEEHLLYMDWFVYWRGSGISIWWNCS